MTNSCGVGIFQFGYDFIGLNAEIGVSDSIGDTPFSPDFSNLSLGWINGVSWDFDNGNISSVENPTETFTLPGEYNVALTISNPFCSNTVYQTIIVNGELHTEIRVPNIFTPNGDGNNDVFSIQTINGTDLTGIIFNRWGKKVKELNGLNATWNGGDSSEGTYYYILEVKFLDDSSKKYEGHIQLIK
jgi:gliding motility-associated-like protein